MLVAAARSCPAGKFSDVDELMAEFNACEQAPEIEEMRSWLDQWGIAEMPMAGTDMPAHDMPGHGDGAGHGMGPDGSMMPGTGAMPMEGMMSAADMAELQNAQGVEAAKLFLEQMIRHPECLGSRALGQVLREVVAIRRVDVVELAALANLLGPLLHRFHLVREESVV